MVSGFQSGVDEDLKFHFDTSDDCFSLKYEYRLSILRPSFAFYVHSIKFSENFHL